MSTPFERDPTDAHEQSDADIIAMLEAYAREWTDLCHEEALQVVVSVGAVLRIIHGLQKKAASWDKRVAYEDQRDDWFAAFSRLPLEQRRLYKNFLAYKDAMKPKVRAAADSYARLVHGLPFDRLAPSLQLQTNQRALAMLQAALSACEVAP